MGFAVNCPLVYLAPKRLLAPSIWKARVASDFDSIVRCRQHKSGFVRLPVLFQLVINQPKAAEGLALGWPDIVDQTTAPRFAMRAPRTHRLCEFLDRHHLAAERAIATDLSRRRCGAHGRITGRAMRRLKAEFPALRCRSAGDRRLRSGCHRDPAGRPRNTPHDIPGAGPGLPRPGLRQPFPRARTCRRPLAVSP